MELLEIMEQRHSVRKYLEKNIESDVRELLEKEIQICNEVSGLNMQLVLDEPRAFGSWFTHFGRFAGVKNYIAFVGKETAETYEKCGYYGEKLVLYAQELGLNTCWVSGSFKPVNETVHLEEGEKIILVIAIGYGRDNGKASKSKTMYDVANITDGQPDWFREGVKAALLAPTAMNRQNFYFTLEGNEVNCKVGETLPQKIDLGIVKYHFEAIAGADKFCWKNAVL